MSNLLVNFSSITFILILTMSSYAQSPNFIIILADDQGWNGTSVQMDSNDVDSKSNYYYTPNLEQMAQNGMTFSQAYAPGAKCSPSRNAILTGKTTARTKHTATNDGTSGNGILFGANSNTAINDADTTIAEWLKGTGLNYVTAHYGKWHLYNNGPENNGFDFGSGSTTNDDGTHSDGLPNQDDPKFMYELTDSAIALMNYAVNNNRPFYLQISHYAVHGSSEGTQYQIDNYNGKTPDNRHDDPDYGAMTENLDSAVGLILQEVANFGLTGTTYIIYTSDNGAVTSLSKNTPLSRGKTFIYEGGIRVPFIIQGPNITGNTRSDEPIVGYDLFPTIAELSGGTNALPTEIDGKDIAGIWDGNGFNRNSGLYFHIPHYESNANKTPRSAIRDGNYKLIVEYETGVNYLYDLSTDNGENTDIAASNTTLVESMRKELRNHFEAVDANFPTLDESNANFSGTGNDVDDDGLDDNWELRKTLAYTYNPTDNVDGDIAIFQEEHDYDSDPLTDEGLSGTEVVFRDSTAYLVESDSSFTVTLVLPIKNTGNDLTINYSVSGTATSGVDFTALSGTAIIENDTNKVEFTLSVIDDLDDENIENITLTLVSGTGYTIGTKNTFTLTIDDNECAQDPLDVTLKTCNKDPSTDGLNESYVETTDTVADTRTITTTGVPNHFYRAPNIAEIPNSYTIDLTPALSGMTFDLIGDNGIAGNLGQALNGVKLEPIAAEPFVDTTTGEEHWNWVLDFTSEPGGFNSDCNYAHQQGNGEYHYHGDMVELANTILSGLGDATTVPTYPIQIGWAADGFPIYYKYGYSNPTDSNTMIVEYTSNYSLKTGSRNGNGISAPCGTYNGRYMQDYEYDVSNGGDLDDCNGVFGVTREFPAGTYYYVVTSSYPMLPRCLKGTPSTDYFKDNALPVELITFDATVQNRNDVLLEWTTLTETNNKGFELSRSRDWQNWEVLTFIEGNGTIIEPTDYQYLDENVSHGEIYYRLKQIDFDGTEDFSEIISVEIENPTQPIKFYPNPTSDIIYYDYSNMEQIQAIHLYNIYGQLMRQQTDIDGSISMADLPIGIYFVIVQMENGSLVKEKIIKH